MEQAPVKLNSNKKLVSIVVIACAVILGGVSIGYTFYMRSPERILSEMLNRWNNAKTFEYSATVKAKFDNPQPPGNPGVPPEGFSDINPFFGMNPNKEIEVLIGLSGVSDNDEKSPKGTLLIDIASATLAPMELALKTEIRVFDETIYFKLNEGTNLGFVNASLAKDQWVKADLKEIVPKEEHKRLKKAQKEEKLRFEKIDKLLRNANLFKLTGVLPGEKIDGQDTYNYEFEISKDELKKLFIQLTKEFGEKTPSKEELKDLDNSLKAIITPKGRIWIGKSDFMPYKITLTMDFANPDDPKAKGKIDITLSYKNFNKPVKIEVPAKTTSLQAFAEKMFAPFSGLEPGHKHMPDGVTPIGPDGKPLMTPPGDIPPQELMLDMPSGVPIF